MKKKQRKWQQNNRDKVNKISAKWKNANPEKVKMAQNNYAKNNPEKLVAKSRRRIAKKKNVQKNYTMVDAQVTKKAFNNKCVKCGSKENLSIDHHMPLNSGYPLTISNAVILCKSCNSSKGTKLPHDFYSVKELHHIELILNKLKKNNLT